MKDTNGDVRPPSADASPTDRDDGKVYCCDTIGYVSCDEFFDHRWETSRASDDDTLVSIEPAASAEPAR